MWRTSLLHGLDLSPAAACIGLVVGLLLDLALSLLVQLAVSPILPVPFKLVAPAPLGVVALPGTALGKLGVGRSAPVPLPPLGAPGADLRLPLGRSALALDVWSSERGVRRRHDETMR